MKLFRILTTAIFALGLSSTSFGGSFICAGRTLYTTGTSRFLDSFSTVEACQSAINSARNGFICAGTFLYTVNTHTFLTSFPTREACQASVDQSRAQPES